ncbi:MAG: hypothetical protein AABW80_02430 [Nanoarchaeota archaeon]
MQNINKKALSNIIAVVLVITIAVSSVAILSNYILELTRSPQLSPDDSCLNFQVNPPITILSSCFNKDTNDIQVSLRRSQNSPSVESINFHFQFEDGALTSYQAGGEKCVFCTILSRGTSKTYFFAVSEMPSLPESVEINTLSCSLEKRRIVNC